VVTSESFQAQKFYPLDGDIQLIEKQLDENPGTWVPYFYADPRETLLGDSMGRIKVVHKTAFELVSIADPLTKEDIESATLRLSWSQWRISRGYFSSQKKNQDGKTVYLLMKPTLKPRRKRR